MTATEGPVRAVVFDLDDTLFDSWTQCVRPAHREAARAMVAAGLRASEDEVFRRRVRLAGIDEDVDAVVSRSFPCADPARAAEAGRTAFFVRDPGPIRPDPFAREVLAAARAFATVVLITTGDPGTQRAKVDRLGLAECFDEIVLDPDYRALGSRSPKRVLLERLLARLGRPPSRVLVVGDRPGNEIRAALDLGCRALRVRRGEFAALPTPPGVPEAPDVRAVLGFFGL